MADMDFHPDVDFKEGALCLSGLSGFDEVDVLLHDIAGNGDVHPLAVRGRIEAESFSCPFIENAELGRPLSFIIRLAGRAGGVVYLRVFVNRGGDNMTITTVVL